MKEVLNEKWIKASIIGTIWAASEIVLGSFLHNLRFPFSGNVLTAIGIVILISMSYRWREKGLFWRAGLICAIMKTMSPSAVIFGPMIAILSEAFLLELSVRLFGRTIVGYALGAIMAMSWNLVQKIANYFIFYGNNIVEVYTNLLTYVQGQLKLKTDIVWLPIIVLLIAYILFGLLAAVIGIKTGRRFIKIQTESERKETSAFLPVSFSGSKVDFGYSLSWLFADLALMSGSFFLLNFACWQVWSIAISAIVTVWALRYKRALRQLSKPKFWIFFVLITLISAFAFTQSRPGENILLSGLLTGIQMNFRAVVIIIGFAVIGTELYNPVIREFFLKTSFKHLPMALELSAESLPSFIAGIPPLKAIIKDPVSVFCGFISHAENRLKEVRNERDHFLKVFIVSAPIGAGKTSYVKSLIKLFREENISVGGIFSERVMEDSVAIGYDLVDIEKEKKTVLMRQGWHDRMETVGRFSVFSEGIAMGRSILRRDSVSWNKIIVIDEIGHLELGGRGWADCFSSLLDKNKGSIIITVRENLTEEVVKKWNLKNYSVFHISDTDNLIAGRSIIEHVNR